MEHNNLKVTPLAQLERYSQGQIVELPPFADGQPFVARLVRPSMLALAKSGKIPNQLLDAANGLFFDGNKEAKLDPDAMKNMFGVVDVICDACFLEPTMQDLREIGLQLTDDQYMYVFNYSQNGVAALKSFRSE